MEPSLQARLRSVLLAMVIFIGFVDALPLNTAPSRFNLREPAVHDELQRIADGLTAMGRPTSVDEVEDRVFVDARRYLTARSFFLKPFKGLRRFTGTGQAWGFFGYPETYPYWIVVEGKVDGGEWEMLYVPRSEHDLLRSKLRYRRLQFMFVDVPRRRKPGRIVGRLANRIAPEVFGARPDIVSVRVYIHREHTPRPGQESNRKPKKRWVQVRHRDR